MMAMISQLQIPMLKFIHIPKTAGMSICQAIKQTSGHRPIVNAVDDDFIFSCVRNPYDRAVSLFYFLKQKSPEYCKQFISKNETPDSFWLKAKTRRQVSFTAPQRYWLKGSARIDCLLRFETLADDWAELANKYKLSRLKHINRSTLRTTQSWQDELTDESIAIIGELYADDFEHLGYERIS